MKFSFSRFFLFLSWPTLLATIVSCAPLHIKEHQASGISGRCGLGSNSKYLQHAGLQMAEYSVTKSKTKNQLTFSAIFWGILGKTIKISSQPVKIRYADKKQIFVSGKLISRQLKNDPKDSPREIAIAFDKSHAFRVDKSYLENFVFLEADFEFHPVGLEIEIPQITIEDEMFPTTIIKFEFTDRWTLVPLNGC